ncbi:MAG TPA: putative toxin-antitoxin system toxin component, PIN family [Gaiellaceae bacterium]
MRAVLDPNILISALLSRRGTPAQIVSHWLAGAFELVVSDALITELERALAYPKLRSRITETQAAEFVALLRHGAIHCADSPPTRHSGDPDDDYLLALAEREQAILVSGDEHLLVLSGELPIMTGVAFRDTLDAS